MQKNKFDKIFKNVILKNIIIIVLYSIVGISINLLISLFIAFVLSNNPNNVEHYMFLLAIPITIGALISGLLVSRHLNKKGIVSGLISSISYGFIVTLLILIFSKFKIQYYYFLVLLLIVLCGCIGGILGVNIKKRK